LVRSKVGERLAEAPAAEVVEHLYGPRILEELRVSFDYLTAVNQAHVVMLARQGVLEGPTAAGLLAAIGDIAQLGREALPVDPEREDLYYNYEQAVIARVGPGVGGQMHTGRSRNDLGATMVRMRCRDVLVGLIGATCQCRQSLTERAAEHAATVMPGYTHLQPAQPITFGHYMLAIEGALARDTGRLFGALERTNMSPLGAGALAGTGFNIAREMAADLLGFGSLVANTLDSVASRDFFLEALAAGSILGVTLSRMAQDLYIWYTYEFRLIDLPDRVAGTSSIMPQKKNPIVLEHIKGRTAHVAGALSAALGAVRNATFSNVIDANREGLHQGWAALEQLEVAIKLSRVAAETAIPRADVMLQRCRANFSTVTELADELVRRWSISFREAHEVVGAVVRESISNGLDAAGITGAMVERAAQEVLGRSITISGEVVEKALDPLHNVAARSHTGGPAPSAVDVARVQAERALASDLARLQAYTVAQADAAERLRDAVAGVIRGARDRSE